MSPQQRVRTAKRAPHKVDSDFVVVDKNRFTIDENNF